MIIVNDNAIAKKKRESLNFHMIEKILSSFKSDCKSVICAFFYCILFCIIIEFLQMASEIKGFLKIFSGRSLVVQ